MFDQLCQPNAPQACSGAAMLLPMQCFLTLTIRCELAEICCRHSHFVGFPRRLGGSNALYFLLTLKKALFTSSDSVSQQSGPVPALPVSSCYASAKARTRSARLTMPTIRPSRSTGTRFMR
jgi:hypothetical protein